MWRVCGDKDKYDRIISSRLNILTRDNDVRSVLRGKDCLQKEMCFINVIQHIVYHRIELVTSLFKTAFSIDPCLGQLKSEIIIRHDLVHRMGHTLDNNIVAISKEEVYSLINKINSIVENIKSNI